LQAGSHEFEFQSHPKKRRRKNPGTTNRRIQGIPELGFASKWPHNDYGQKIFSVTPNPNFLKAYINYFIPKEEKFIQSGSSGLQVWLQQYSTCLALS
jgi:hypothetical protein